MSDTKIYPVDAHFAATAHLDGARYREQYARSIADPENFWAEHAQALLHWDQAWHTVTRCDFKQGLIRWFEGGRLNVSVNCLDRHLATRGKQTAILWEGDTPGQNRQISYRELHATVCRLAHALTALGVTKGDRVCIYLPMIPEAAVAMLACTRIGAVHSVVFGGFSAEALRDRLQDAACKVLICADGSRRGGRIMPVKVHADQALAACPSVQHVIVVRHTGSDVTWQAGRDVWYHDITATQPDSFPPVSMDAEDPLFILYTSGSTGKPKGVLHTTGGYLLYAALTHRWVFDHRDGDIYWCTADVGWVTGHSYVVYGPLCNGATTLMFEGIPTYPEPDRFWRVVETHRVSLFYTAPTAIRALMAQGAHYVERTDRSSLRLLGSVGEPINPEAWEWYYHVVGEGRCPIVDTWWQTETGGILITPLPGATPLKPGSAAWPFFGIVPEILDNAGEVLHGEAEGILVLARSWPGQARTVYGDHQRFIDTYFRNFPGYYFTGDGAKRDRDGYYWITGRIDDVINVSGHRLGTAEIESALVQHPDVAEAAVVGYPHEIKGQGIYAYVTLNTGVTPSDALRQELIQLVRKEIGPIANPDIIQWAPALPKTRSGKIMRRILRKVAANDLEHLGDMSTLADPSVVEDLITHRANLS